MNVESTTGSAQEEIPAAPKDNDSDETTQSEEHFSPTLLRVWTRIVKTTMVRKMRDAVLEARAKYWGRLGVIISKHPWHVEHRQRTKDKKTTLETDVKVTKWSKKSK